ncbi:MAG: DNA mismatch repair endonuclease MutL [Pirellula sp.]|jgi:DNA mismatch repair protein MutL|nr:DNA mismatch repair endonuclease MutL [Pirellula sp.]
MPIIRQLPVSLVNKIAAGEVIERPASVVKEMLENSIDAGSDLIEVMVSGGGIDLLRISDNGCGIEPEQLELALAPHATSKLADSEDLFDVRTLGFRGEALASIAEISHMTLRSRVASSDGGYELRAQGSDREPIKPCAMNVGTTIEVRHLFFNTPVRRKFMKTPSTEMGHVVEAFTRIALAFPNVHMKLSSNDRVQYDLPPTNRWSERIRAFFGDEIADALISVEHEDEKVKVRGYVADPSVSRSNNRMQYLFLNGRYIRDRALQHALSEAYRGLLMVGRLPICFLQMQIDPKTVDVNVHPTKVEVRFEDSGAIYSRLLHTIRHRFLTSNLVAKAPQAADPNSPGNLQQGQNLAPRTPEAESNTSLMDWARSQQNVPAFQPFPNAGFSPDVYRSGNPFPGNSFPGANPFPGGSPANSPNSAQATTSFEDQLPEGTAASLPIESPAIGASMGASIGASTGVLNRADGSHEWVGSTPAVGFQIHNRYLITQDDAGMVIIDQHALHERILFEQIKTKVLSRSLDRQRMLMPATVQLTSSEAAMAIESKAMLAEIGFEIESFGGDTVLLSAYPSILSKRAPEEMLRTVLEALMSGGKKVNAQDVLDELMNMMACKAAIKAGDRLSDPEISALLEQRHLYHDTHHCPHGRPTALFFSKEQLDKMFKRI